MNRHPSAPERWLCLLAAFGLFLSACVPAPAAGSARGPIADSPAASNGGAQPVGAGLSVADPSAVQTPLPQRPSFKPGELVDYAAQTGDTLPALAARFNTTVDEILAANPIIPADATTMPPGLPMKVPIYYRALWASPFQIIPDHAFVNGPLLIGFSTAAFVAEHDGWLRSYRVYAGGEWRSGAGMVDYIARNYSISPRLLLAILEHQTGALSNPQMPARYSLDFRRIYYETPYLQLVLAGNVLNNGYYGWRDGSLIDFDLADGSLLRPDPWQNAGSVAVQYYFSKIYSGDRYAREIGPSGLYQTYTRLFGDPWADSTVLIPGSLQQPELTLPFQPGLAWSYSGGPHTGWGTGQPFAAVDFAPPDNKQYATAIAAGLVLRSDVDGVIIDLDMDGDERTGWVIFYLHLATPGRVAAGKEVQRGEKIGFPSTEGGHATGVHVHLARKYNGEWILADSALPFVMENWVVHNGDRPYLGTLTRRGLTVRACECGDAYSSIRAEYP